LIDLYHHPQGAVVVMTLWMDDLHGYEPFDMPRICVFYVYSW